MDYEKEIVNIARRESRGLDNYDPEDLAQDLRVFLIESDYFPQFPREQVVSLLKKRAKKIARDERVAYMYFRGAFLYTPQQVRLLLENVAWSDVETVEDVDGKVDIEAAFRNALTPHRQRLIYKKYALGYDGFTEVEARTIREAIDAMTAWLNSNSKQYAGELDPEAM